MALHHFTLIVDGPDVQDEALIDALFEAGCDDALVGRAEGIPPLSNVRCFRRLGLIPRHSARSRP